MDSLHSVAAGFLQAKVLLAAAELRVFEALTDTRLTAAEVAVRVGGRLRGVEILLDALAAIGALEKRGARYGLHPDHERELRADSPSQLLAALRHRNRMFRHWAFLEERITGGEVRAPRIDRGALEDPEANANFIRAMYAFTRDAAAGVVERVDLEGVRTLADLGGGPGHYAAELVQRSGSAAAWLLDLPLTLEVARGLLAESPARERIHLVAWDFYAEPPPPELPVFDLVFVSQVLHAESPERNLALLGKLRPLVAPGGRVVVHEGTVDPDRTSPIDAALFAVNMLAMTEGGRSYTNDEILGWGRATGFEPGTVLRLGPRSVLLTLTKPLR